MYVDGFIRKQSTRAPRAAINPGGPAWKRTKTPRSQVREGKTTGARRLPSPRCSTQRCAQHRETPYYVHCGIGFLGLSGLISDSGKRLAFPNLRSRLWPFLCTALEITWTLRNKVYFRGTDYRNLLVLVRNCQSFGSSWTHHVHTFHNSVEHILVSTTSDSRRILTIWTKPENEKKTSLAFSAGLVFWQCICTLVKTLSWYRYM